MIQPLTAPLGATAAGTTKRAIPRARRYPLRPMGGTTVWIMRTRPTPRPSLMGNPPVIIGGDDWKARQ